METSFAIAYADKDGKDFNGIPWIGDAPVSREECLSMAQGLVSDGYKNVIPFQYEPGKDCPEEITWSFAKLHRIDTGGRYGIK